jgi:hypothetical protein
MSHVPMTDTEITRFVRRRDVFMQHGLPEPEANKLADQLMRRDRPEEGDNRRVCWECQHFKAMRCLKGQAALPWILQRCDFFKLKGTP